MRRLLQAPGRETTAAVVTLFHPEGDLLSRLARIGNEVSNLILVANDGIHRDFSRNGFFAAVHYLKNGRNLGLATALNQGMQRSFQLGANWCLLLDQDTLIDCNFIAGLEDAYQACPFADRVGILAANYRNLAGKNTAYPTEVSWQHRSTVVTSGSLIRSQSVRECGGMREEFFIEGIDLEFSLRLRRAGWLVVATGRPLMTHGAGRAEERRFFGRRLLISFHAPDRWFLQFRNLAWILCRYGESDWSWFFKTLAAAFKRVILLLIFEDQIFRKLFAAGRGVLAGVSDNFPRSGSRKIV